MSLLCELLLIALAGMQVVELYQHGSIFGPWPHGLIPIRAWARKVHREIGEEAELLKRLPRLYQRLALKITAFFTCPFCEAPWACLGTALLWFKCGLVGQLIIFALAGSRCANLVNDLTHNWTRSPFRQEESDEDEKTEET